MRRLLCFSCITLALWACDDDNPVADAGAPDVEASDADADADLDAAPDAAPDAGCAPGDERLHTCPDGREVAWCLCTGEGWECAAQPEDVCRPTLCDDGAPLVCDAEQPTCDATSVAAIIDGCWLCVNPMSCRPWAEAGCASDADCPADSRCNPCAHGSCPECEDCVAECEPHGCATEDEDEVICDMLRPDCGERISIVEDGCWVCVDRQTCAPTPSACAQAGGYCAHFMDDCEEGFEGGPPMDCPLGRSGQCCLPAVACVPEGEFVLDEAQCCAGLAPIECSASLDGVCEPCDSPPTCAPCGDGVCNGDENICNCPADCDGAPNVVPDTCEAPIDCLAHGWNIRCLGRWTCVDSACVEECDFEGCGDGVCAHESGESASSCSADCAGVAECEPGATTAFGCPDGAVVPWCTCTAEARWQCVFDPADDCPGAAQR